MFRLLRTIQEERGSLIVESMVATTLIVIGILGIISLLARSANLSHYASHSFQATYLAAEGIEVVKNILDTDISRGAPWGASIKGTPPFCVYYDTTGSGTSLPSCTSDEQLAFDPSTEFVVGPAAGGLYRREVTIVQTGAAYDVVSTVKWKEGSDQKTVVLEDIFYPWRTQ